VYNAKNDRKIDLMKGLVDQALFYAIQKLGLLK